MAGPRYETCQVGRSRLHNLLSVGLTTSRMTTVVAPPGYGKTTLVAAWLAELSSRGMPLAAAWLTLDETIDDLRSFLRHLAAAVRRAFPDFLPSYNHMLNTVPGPPAKQLVDELLRGLAKLPERLVVVLDNYDTLTQPEIDAGMKSIVQYQPAGLHLVIISSKPLGLLPPSWRRQLRGVTSISRADLRFTSDEVATYLAAHRAHTVTESDIRLVMEATNGIALPVALYSLLPPVDDPALWRDFIRRSHKQKTGPGMRRLLDQIMDSRPPDEQKLLVAAAMLGRVNAELAAAALASSDPTAFAGPLAALATEQVLLWRAAADSPHEPPWYTIHPAVGQIILDQRAADPAFADLAAATRRRGSNWLLGHGMLVNGLWQLRQANDDDGLMRTINTLLPKLEVEDRWHDVGRLLGLLPAPLIDRSPELLLAQSWVAFMQRDTDRLTPLLNQTEALLATRTGLEPAALMLAEIDIMRGVPLIDMTARRARRNFMHQILMERPQRRKWAHTESLHALLVASITRAETEETEQIILAALNNPPDDQRLQDRLWLVLGMLYYRCGPVDKLEKTSLRLLERGKANQSGLLVGTAQMGLGTAAYLRDDSAQAVVQLSAAIHTPTIDEPGLLTLNAYHLIHAMAQLGLSEQIGLTLVEINRLRHTGDSFDIWDWPAILALGQLLSGDEAAAFRWADTAYLPPPSAVRARLPFVLAEIRLVQGNRAGMAAALDYLRHYMAELEHRWFPRNMTQALALTARLLARLGDWAGGAAALGQAIRLGYPLGFVRYLVDGGPELGKMLSQLAMDDTVAAALAVAYEHRHQPTTGPDKAPPPPADLLLTRREMEILQQLAGSLNAKEIAGVLHISPFTIRNHTARLYEKLGVSTRSGAVRRGRELGLLR